MEAWRFTDLSGFDPDAFSANGARPVEEAPQMLESEGAELSAYSNAAVELFVQEGAKLEYVSLQNLARETWHFATHHAQVERDAELDWVAGGFGSRRGKIRIQTDLNGPGATSRVTGAYF